MSVQTGLSDARAVVSERPARLTPSAARNAHSIAYTLPPAACRLQFTVYRPLRTYRLRDAKDPSLRSGWQ